MFHPNFSNKIFHNYGYGYLSLISRNVTNLVTEIYRFVLRRQINSQECENNIILPFISELADPMHFDGLFSSFSLFNLNRLIGFFKVEIIPLACL